MAHFLRYNTPMTNKHITSQNELHQTLIEVAYQKDLNLFNTSIFSCFVLAFSLYFHSLFSTNGHETLAQIFATFCGFLLVFKVLYLNYSEIAMQAGFDQENSTILDKIKAI